MREALNQWEFVIGAYSVSLVLLVLLFAWSWAVMRRAEQRRDAMRSQSGAKD